jgi:DNA helicase-2/ATP-dependent DNA helicase PcrA
MIDQHHDLLRGLNEPQRQAVTSTEGPLLILAGPGSGKTRAITHRIAYLMREQQVQPWHILAVTFTNKAAKEMRDRLTALAGEDSRDVAMGTFHAICARILRQEADDAGIDKRFTIFDDDDQVTIAKQALKDLNLDEKQHAPRSILSRISTAKNKLITVRQFEEQARSYRDEIVARVYRRYQDLLRENNGVDFDDLIMLVCQLWRQHPDVLARYQNKYRYVHVDEFQDTNEAQYKLVWYLGKGPEATGRRNVCVVADDDQCLVEGTLITMADESLRPIEAVKSGDEVLSAFGSGEFRPARVLAAARRERDGAGIAITTASGRRLISTPEHMHFAGYRLGITPQLSFTYLMHKRGVGFRIGTSRVYTKSQIKPVVGFMQRARQEHADAAWVISAHASENKARAEEYILSLRYRIPTLPFVPRAGSLVNGLVHDATYIRRVFEAFDTEANGRELLKDAGLSLDHPHFRPRSRNSNRMHVTITLCADCRSYLPIHRISLNGNAPSARSVLESLGLRVSYDKPGIDSWTYDAMNSDMGVLIERARNICKVINADMNFIARLGRNSSEDVIENKSLPFLPAASVRPGMVMFDAEGGYDVVERVETVALDAPVYDLDIERTHNFIANGIVTHNSIYSWRGADVRNVFQFEADFGPQVILLEQNYRSTQTILDAAHAVVQRNRERKDKKLWTTREGGPRIALYEAYNEDEEGQFVARKVETLVREGYRYRDCAVMYRTNAQSRALEEQLLRAGIPYVVIGSKKFYERKEIKDLLAYLRLLANPTDMLSLRRIINVPSRKIGPKTVDELLNWAAAGHLLPLEAARRVEEHPALTASAKNAVARFGAIMADLQEAASTLRLPALIDRILDRTGYAADLRDGTPEGEEHWENVLELRRLATDYSEIEPLIALDLFLEQIALVGGAETAQTSANDAGKLAEESRDAVTLITLHAAKGLEFPIVFMVGMDEGMLPHARSLQDHNQMAEERRLAYVGITRAKDRLYLVHAFRRAFYGSFDSTPMEPSRFLGDIPIDLIEEENRSRNNRLREETDDDLPRTTTRPAGRGYGASRAGGPYHSGSGFSSGSGYVSPYRGSRAGAGSGAGGSYHSGSGGFPHSNAGMSASGGTRRQETSAGSSRGSNTSPADIPGEPAPTRPESPIEPQFKGGERVRHHIFGEGTILRSELSGDSEVVEVLFKGRTGKKVLDLAFAKLERL